MTQSITPSPELVQQWANESPMECSAESWAYELFIAHHAAQWGADQELEACRHYFARDLRESLALELRAARRPKPPSLKDEAMNALAWVDKHLDMPLLNHFDAIHIIRRALEALPE
jgi:hypothetical protein